MALRDILNGILKSRIANPGLALGDLLTFSRVNVVGDPADVDGIGIDYQAGGLNTVLRYNATFNFHQIGTLGSHPFSLMSNGVSQLNVTDGILFMIGAARFLGGAQFPDGVAAPSTISGVASVYVDIADGDLKCKFGDGTVKTIVTDT